MSKQECLLFVLFKPGNVGVQAIESIRNITEETHTVCSVLRYTSGNVSRNFIFLDKDPFKAGEDKKIFQAALLSSVGGFVSPAV